MALTTPINFKAWIDEHRHLLKPPVGNKVVWKDGEFIVMVVGGPNARKDYHHNPTPEFFHQLEGSMTLKVKDGDTFKEIRIQEGEIFLLPGGVPHSPQREAGTVGLVLEQQRPAGQQDGLLWFCDNCGNKLYEERFVLQNVETDFPPVFDRFWSKAENRTCKKCGTVMPERGK